MKFAQLDKDNCGKAHEESGWLFYVVFGNCSVRSAHLLR
jgi:hypothetical protein